MSIAAELSALDDEQRRLRIEQIIQDPSAPNGDKAVACNRAAFDAWQSGQTVEAIAAADRGLHYAEDPIVRVRIQALKALACLDAGDVNGALSIVSNDPDDEVPCGVLAEWIGIRARGLAKRQEAAAFDQFRRAADLFGQADRPGNVAAMQVDAAILALAVGDLAEATYWTTALVHEPYAAAKRILSAQILQQAGHVAEALREIESIELQLADRMDDNDKARAHYVAAMGELALGQSDRAAHRLESAARLAYHAKPLDMDLVRRIQRARQAA